MAKQLPSQQRRFGAHMSIAGGLHLAVSRAVEAGCDVLQVFVKNQRQWTAAPLSEEDVAEWKRAWAESPIGAVVAHNSYLVNLASPKAETFDKSMNAMLDELERCEQLGIGGLVAHPGSHLGEGEEAGLRKIAKALDDIHRQTRGYTVKVLLETTAGQGTNLGHRFEHLGRILDLVKAPERLGVCFDTCHVFAAGYDLQSEEGYAATMDELDAAFGCGRIACFHVNDSKHPRGSRKDRHEHIGQGELGRKPFQHLINDARFHGIPMILETPKGEDDRGRDHDKLMLAKLRRMVKAG